MSDLLGAVRRCHTYAEAADMLAKTPGTRPGAAYSKITALRISLPGLEQALAARPMASTLANQFLDAVAEVLLAYRCDGGKGWGTPEGTVWGFMDKPGGIVMNEKALRKIPDLAPLARALEAAIPHLEGGPENTKATSTREGVRRAILNVVSDHNAEGLSAREIEDLVNHPTYIASPGLIAAECTELKKKGRLRLHPQQGRNAKYHLP